MFSFTNGQHYLHIDLPLGFLKKKKKKRLATKAACIIKNSTIHQFNSCENSNTTLCLKLGNHFK